MRRFLMRLGTWLWDRMTRVPAPPAMPPPLPKAEPVCGLCARPLSDPMHSDGATLAGHHKFLQAG